MKTFSTDGRISRGVVLPGDPDAILDAAADTDSDTDTGTDTGTGTAETPEEQAWHADTTDALTAARNQPRFITLPGREPTDLESISDLWLD